MSQALEELQRIGLPDGGVRALPRGPYHASAASSALLELEATADALEAPTRDAVVAWLRAFQQHWPEEFMRSFGLQGERLIARLMTSGVDENRYLKLRRIALENLAQLL